MINNNTNRNPGFSIRHMLSIILRMLDDRTDPRLSYHLHRAYELAMTKVERNRWRGTT